MNQNKISKRQLKRMLFIEGFGVSGLSLPAVAAWNSTSEGMIPMICYGIFLMILTAYFLWVSEKQEEGHVFVLHKWVAVLYLLRFLVHGIFLFCFFGLFIQTVYMPETGMLQILLPFGILLWYCTRTTLQKRARFLELMFPWIITIFSLLIFFSFLGLWGEAVPIPWTEDFVRVWKNGYYLLLCTTPLEFLFFLLPSVTENLWGQSSENQSEETKAARKCVWQTVAGIFLGNVLLWFFSVETLGGTLTSSSPWPVIKLLQLIRMPGGFLERFDILLAIFWLLCLIGVLSGYVFYGKQIVGDTLGIRRGAGFVIVLFLIFSVFVFPVNAQGWLEGFLFYKKWIDFPLMMLLPLFARKTILTKNEKTGIKTMVGIFAVMIAAFTLTGCRNQEDVEEKSYVLSLYVDDCGAGYEYWVAKADLSSMEEKEQNIPCTVIQLNGENLEDMAEKYQKTEVGELEWNHIYTIFLGPSLVKNEEKLGHFLQEWEASWQKSPNVLLAVCMQDADDLYQLKNLPDASAGQEVSRLAEQEEKKKEEKNPILCRTPVEVLREREKGQQEIQLYQTKLRRNQIVLGEYSFTF